MVSATKGAFCWGISNFLAFRTVVLATAFGARVRPVAVASRMPVLLTACTLWDVVFVCSRWFYVYDFILYGRNFVKLFVVLGRFIKNLIIVLLKWMIYYREMIIF